MQRLTTSGTRERATPGREYHYFLIVIVVLFGHRTSVINKVKILIRSRNGEYLLQLPKMLSRAVLTVHVKSLAYPHWLASSFTTKMNSL